MKSTSNIRVAEETPGIEFARGTSIDGTSIGNLPTRREGVPQSFALSHLSQGQREAAASNFPAMWQSRPGHAASHILLLPARDADRDHRAGYFWLTMLFAGVMFVACVAAVLHG